MGDYIRNEGYIKKKYSRTAWASFAEPSQPQVTPDNVSETRINKPDELVIVDIAARKYNRRLQGCILR